MTSFTDRTLTIGEVGEQTGVATHVLRHWDDVGVLPAHRDALGHRRYGPDDVAAVALIRLLQRTGLSLDDLNAMLATDRVGRVALVRAHEARLAAQAADLDAARAYLAHTLECRHPATASCPECRAFAADAAAAGARAQRPGPGV